MRINVSIASFISILLAISNCSRVGNSSDHVMNENNDSLPDSAPPQRARHGSTEYQPNLVADEIGISDEHPRLSQICDEPKDENCCTSPEGIAAFAMVCAEVHAEATQELLETCSISLPSRRQIVNFTRRGLRFFRLC